MANWPIFLFTLSLSLSFWCLVVLEISPPSQQKTKEYTLFFKITLFSPSSKCMLCALSWSFSLNKIILPINEKKKNSVLVDFVISSLLSHFVWTPLLMLTLNFWWKSFSWIFLVFYWLASYICFCLYMNVSSSLSQFTISVYHTCKFLIK